MSNSNMGIDYFSVDVGIFRDAKIIKLLHRYGALGFTSYFIIISNVYMVGYYLDFSVSDLVHLVLSHIPSKFISGKNKLQEIILYIAEIDLIDKKLLSQNVVTSRGIQKRFLIATKKRKSQDLSKYWLLETVDKETSMEPIPEEVLVKTKPTKKERIRENRIKDIGEHAPKKHYLTSCLITYRYIDNYSLDIHKYNQLFEDLGQRYDQELLYEAVRYLCNYASRTTTKIDDSYKFFESSITKNLERLTSPSNKLSIEEFFQSLINKNN